MAHNRMGRSSSPTDLAQKAFVRGISDEVDEDDLKRTFSKYGTVVDVHIAKDRETNSSRGYAFITFTSSTDCSKACSAMDGKEYHGNELQVELATRTRGGGLRGGFRGSRGRSSFRGGRGRGASSPGRDTFRRGGGSFRGSFRGGASARRGDFKDYSSRRSDNFYSGEDRYRSTFDREPPRDYGSRYDSSLDYRPGRNDRDFFDDRDYPSYRERDFQVGPDRDYMPPRVRDYYTPPRDYPPMSRDYPPISGGRDYQMPRGDRDFDMPPRRYAPRDFDDGYPSGNGVYDSRPPPRREYDGPPPREYGSGRDSGYTRGGRGTYKSTRGSFSPRGSRDDYPRGMPPRRPPRDDRNNGAGMRRPHRSLDGPPPKKMRTDEALHRSPRGGGSSSRRY